MSFQTFELFSLSGFHFVYDVFSLEGKTLDG